MSDKNDNVIDVLDCQEEAPYLHLNANYLNQEMAEIFWNPCVEAFLRQIYYLDRESPTWEEEEILDEDMPFEIVANYLLMLKDSDKEWPGIYRALQVAVQVPYGENIGDLLEELPVIWENEKSKLFLSLMTDIIDSFLFYREKEAIKKVDREDRTLMSHSVPRLPDKILA